MKTQKKTPMPKTYKLTQFVANMQQLENSLLTLRKSGHSVQEILAFVSFILGLPRTSMKTQKTYDMTKHFLEELEHPYRELTDWEAEFIESVSEQFNSRGTLSDRQFEILERIYAEKTA